MMKSIDIVFSTSRRVDLFEDTIKTLIKFNPDINDYINIVWTLDDRTNYTERSLIEILVDRYFPNKGRMITFNDNREKYSYVNKFSLLKWIGNGCDYILFIEEDWRSWSTIDIKRHIDYLEKNKDIDQIVFSENFHIQEDSKKPKFNINETYWEPKDSFRHIYGFSESESNFYYKWLVCRPIFTFNPSLIKSKVFDRGVFRNEKEWEDLFHNEVKANQIYTKDNKFIHTGEFRSSEGTKWN